MLDGARIRGIAVEAAAQHACQDCGEPEHREHDVVVDAADLISPGSGCVRRKDGRLTGNAKPIEVQAVEAKRRCACIQTCLLYTSDAADE